MAEPLWKIRERKGMTVNQLASKSGVPAISINEYESGRAVRSADLPKLAKALFVEEWDIQYQSEPRPKPARRSAPPPPSAERAEPERAKPERAKPRPTRKPAAEQPARPTQIEHLLTLTERHFNKDRAVLEAELGKPLDTLTRGEASTLLSQYQQQLAESKPGEPKEDGVVKRKRAYLPESVDEFEFNYLTEHQQAGTLIHFTLFDGRQMRGTIHGFSPYSITIREAETGDEVTLQKLAIAYYRTAAAPGGTQPQVQSQGDEP